MRYAPTLTSSGNLFAFEATMINQNNFERETLDVKQAAAKLGVCDETVRRLVRRKIIKRLPGIRRILIPVNQIVTLLDGADSPPVTSTMGKSVSSDRLAHCGVA
ncbi:MAG: helix-turn-helix domain-containing protein [Verrucomicrobiales bacterium]|nr:helix-turn-helix domain-containing protein [Verrucomicrobiales bacterium]